MPNGREAVGVSIDISPCHIRHIAVHWLSQFWWSVAARGAMTRTNAPATVKRERLEARVSPEQKALIERAAQLQGRSITDFLVASAQQEAERVIREHEVLVLSPRDSEAFVRALLNPPPPNEALCAAFRRHRDLIASRE